jgi:hypothetical protein
MNIKFPLCLSVSFRSAIGVAWLFITTSCIPVGFAHGLHTFEDDGYMEMKCIFLEDEGYNHAAFQVSKNL